MSNDTSEQAEKSKDFEDHKKLVDKHFANQKRKMTKQSKSFETHKNNVEQLLPRQSEKCKTI